MSKLFIFNLNILKKFSCILIIISIIFSNINQIKTQNELAQKLQFVINSIAEEMPQNFREYFTIIRSIGILKVDKCDLSIAPQRLKNIHNFSGQVIEYFDDIIFAQSTHFKTFSFNLNLLNSDYREFLGAARVIDNKVEFAYIEVITESKTIPRTNERSWTTCRNYILWKECTTHYERYTVGFTQEDMTTIYKTLRAHSYMHIKLKTENILSALQSKEFVLSENSQYFSNNGVYFLKIQEDANLVLYRIENGHDYPIWASETYKKSLNAPYMLCIEKNGDLIVYDSAWNILWMADFQKNENLPYSLEISDDGIMKLNDNKGNLMWKNGDNVKGDLINENKLRFLQ